MHWFRNILDPNNKLLMTTYHDAHNLFYENIYALFSQDIKMYMDLQRSNQSSEET